MFIVQLFRCFNKSKLKPICFQSSWCNFGLQYNICFGMFLTSRLACPTCCAVRVLIDILGIGTYLEDHLGCTFRAYCNILCVSNFSPLASSHALVYRAVRAGLNWRVFLVPTLRFGLSAPSLHIWVGGTVRVFRAEAFSCFKNTFITH